MRLFVALQPSPDVCDALTDVQERLRAAGVTAGYLAPSNLHLTLAFIGEWPENMTPLLPAVRQPFSITLSHVGIFPEARVLWAGVKHSQALDDLANQVRQTLSGAGIPFDPRAFYPHITLGRKPTVPEKMDLSAFQVPPAVMRVRHVCLYRSDHEAHGMVYTVIGRTAE